MKTIGFLKLLGILIAAGVGIAGLIILGIKESDVSIVILRIAANILGGLLVGTGSLFAIHELRAIIIQGELSAEAAAGASFSIAVGAVLLNV